MEGANPICAIKMDLEEVKESLLLLTERGLVLPFCPICAIPMDLESEVIPGKCKSCGTPVSFDDIRWFASDTLSQA